MTARKSKKKVTIEGEKTPAAISLVVKVRLKPPAVMVRVKHGMSYADTVVAVRKTSGVDVESLGATIRGIRRTRDGHVLLEFNKGVKAEEASKKLSGLLLSSVADQVGDITTLGALSDIEVVDIDAGADREEVEQALNKAVSELNLGITEKVQLNGLWLTRSGMQVATARISRMSADRLERVAIGWTMCRVRPRMQGPRGATVATALDTPLGPLWS